MPVAAAIAGAAVIGGVTTTIAGNKAAKAQKSAAQTQADASTRATELQIAEQRRQYDQTRADYAPYRAVGTGALGKLAGMYGIGADGKATTPNDGGFTTSPGYQFSIDQATKAAERTAAARGTLNSGGFTKSLARYVTGAASNEYDAYANRLAALAGVGQSATGNTAAAGQNASNAISNAYGANGAAIGNAAMAAGNASASSYANTGSAINGTVNNLASTYLYTQGGFGGGGVSGAYGIKGSDGFY